MKKSKSKGKKKKRINRGIKKILDLGLFLLFVLVATYILSRYVVERITVQNHSMESTLLDKDSILIDKISYKYKSPERFDIIVFRQAGSNEELVKRIIGLPNETIMISDGIIYIDGEEIRDVKGLQPADYAGLASLPMELGEGEYFVIGDNRQESIDSRYSQIGNVTSSRIIGRCFMRIWPINHFKIFSSRS